jgi:hypothetical protein
LDGLAAVALGNRSAVLQLLLAETEAARGFFLTKKPRCTMPVTARKLENRSEGLEISLASGGNCNRLYGSRGTQEKSVPQITATRSSPAQLARLANTSSSAPEFQIALSQLTR